VARTLPKNRNPLEIIFDSTLMADIGEGRKHKLPIFYFPLVIGIFMIEFIVLILVLFNILPLHQLEIYATAGYFTFIGASDISQISVTITRWFFFLLTAGVLLPTSLIIALEIIRRLIIARRGDSLAWDTDYGWLNKLDRPLQKTELDPDRSRGEYITRFDIHQRLQHYALFISFIILAVTGMLRGFPYWPTFQWFTALFGGPDILRLVHDFAAFVMILDCIYHVGYIAYGFFVKGKFPYSMLPSLKDLKDMIHSFLWIFGQYQNEPVYDRFQYGQKIDYWAIFWGMPVMVITGIIMMFPLFFSQWFAGQWFAVVATAHRDEAVLATGFIIIVHMYYGHLQTTAFPVNTVMFTGKMLKSKYKQWFGREYAQITGEKAE
jgi:cytochrome b subunit of formate dehydrogenase